MTEVILPILSVLAIFAVTIIITRVFGLRTFAKMSSFDFASTIAVGSVIASVILNPKYSILKGSIVLFSIIAFQTLFSFIIRKSSWLQGILTNKPKLIMWEGKILDQQLKKCNVGKDDLIGKLREANVHDFKEVRAVIFESTGDISVIHNSENKNLSKSLLTDVNMEFIHD